MGTQNISIISRITNWCGSATGVLTFLIVAITISRVILTAIREKNGKDSLSYRNSKSIFGGIYLIFFVNCLGAIGKWLFGASSVAKANFTAGSWVLSAISIIIYIILTAAAFKRNKIPLSLIATTILIFSLHIIHNSGLVTTIAALVGIVIDILFICACCLEDENKDGDNKDNTAVSVNKPAITNVLIAIAWIVSVVTAYIAGEYSLIPKAIEYIQKHFKKADTTQENPTEESEPTPTNLVTE